MENPVQSPELYPLNLQLGLGPNVFRNHFWILSWEVAEVRFTLSRHRSRAVISKAQPAGTQHSASSIQSPVQRSAHNPSWPVRKDKSCSSANPSSLAKEAIRKCVHYGANMKINLYPNLDCRYHDKSTCHQTSNQCFFRPVILADVLRQLHKRRGWFQQNTYQYVDLHTTTKICYLPTNFRN